MWDRQGLNMNTDDLSVTMWDRQGLNMNTDACQSQCGTWSPYGEAYFV